jgi:hypothetical protein
VADGAGPPEAPTDDAAPEDPEMGGSPPGWRHWSSWEDAYGLTLALLLLTLILPIFVGQTRRLTFLTSIIGLAACLIALHSSRVRPAIFWAAVGAVALGLGALVVDIVRPSSGAHGLLTICVGSVLLITPPAILVRIARHKVITPRTLCGALSVYLLAGLAFSFLYQAIDYYDAHAFDGIARDDRAAFAYYSFITLTTTGYGDIVPTARVSRSLAVFEVLMGQIFLVVIVARVVSMLGHERMPRSNALARRIHRTEDGEDEPASGSEP